MGAAEGLEEVVVDVDQPRDDDMPAGVEPHGDGHCWLLAGGDQLSNAAVLDRHAASRSLGKHGQRVTEPSAHAGPPQGSLG